MDRGRPYTEVRHGRCQHDVTAGTWHDPYTGQAMTFTDVKDQQQAQLIPVDHVVALASSWRYGAHDWTENQRLQLATDLLNLQPTSRAINSAKRDRDAADWRPKKPFQCAYATRYVQVKAKYELPVDRSEKAALEDMLTTCRTGRDGCDAYSLGGRHDRPGPADPGRESGVVGSVQRDVRARTCGGFGDQPSTKERPVTRTSRALDGALTGFSGLLVSISLTMAASLLYGLTYLLPGVGNYEEPHQLILQAVLSAPFLVGAGYLICHFRTASMFGTESSTTSAWTHFRKIVAFELRTLGFTRQGFRRLLGITLIGVGVALAAVVVARVLASSFSWVVPSTDPRDVINNTAPAWSAAVFGVMGAAPVEEMAYRGSLLFAAAGLRHLQRRAVLSIRLSVALQLIALVVTSLLFGGVHLEFSVFNAVVTSVGGLIWGAAALWTRSIVPALLGHGVYNAIAFGGQAGG